MAHLLLFVRRPRTVQGLSALAPIILGHKKALMVREDANDKPDG
tara:strand:- start:5664 stop:5795 length:132 start_codon:yes stop_codon:yes gene_type:complete